jgi:hypothetical protein
VPFSPGRRDVVRVELKEYGIEQELYVDGILVLAGEGMGAREALEAIGEFSSGMEPTASEHVPEGTMSLFKAPHSSPVRPRTMAGGM